MVYLREILHHNKERILELKNIELAAYLYISRDAALENLDFELSPDEAIALKGYISEQVEKERVMSILAKPAIKGINATSNIYKLCGLYLAAKADVLKELTQKYRQSDLKQKYFIARIEPSFITQLQNELSEQTSNSIETIIKSVLGQPLLQTESDNALTDIPNWEMDIQSQILLQDFEKQMLKTTFINKSAEEIVREVLKNFSNAIQKIIKDRRKGHAEYLVQDEYDVQDILYVILKSIFPLLRDEDPIPKVGAKSTKIDLILREEKILIEVKMIKEKDSNETEFIEQLKKDFESYHQCQWLEKLFCFVYDPYRKTKDIANFNDLNGTRLKNDKAFNVEIIVSN